MCRTAPATTTRASRWRRSSVPRPVFARCRRPGWGRGDSPLDTPSTLRGRLPSGHADTAVAPSTRRRHGPGESHPGPTPAGDQANLGLGTLFPSAGSSEEFIAFGEEVPVRLQSPLLWNEDLRPMESLQSVLEHRPVVLAEHVQA